MDVTEIETIDLSEITLHASVVNNYVIYIRYSSYDASKLLLNEC